MDERSSRSQSGLVALAGATGSAPAASSSIRHSQRCQYCGRKFNRRWCSDSLRRHLRTHDPNRVIPTRKKSCQNCVKSKVRCSGDVPACSSCQRRSLRCRYTTELPERLTAASAGASVTEPVAGGYGYDVAALSFNGASQNLAPDQQHDLLVLDPETVQMPDIGDFMGTSLFPEHGESDMNWLFDTSAANSMQSVEDFFSGSDCFQGNWELDGLAFRQPTPSKPPDDLNRNLPPPSPKECNDPDNPWPMVWRAQADQLVAVPDLNGGDRISIRHFAIDAMTEATWNKVIDTLKLALQRGPWKPLASTNLPRTEYWDFFIDLYFAHFHPVVPVVHRATFSPNRAAVVVTIAMAATGACYSGLDARHQFACALWELNRRLLWVMSESDPRYIRTESYMTAQLLQSIYAKNCGEKRLLELGESSRSQLVNNAVSMGLFQNSDYRDESSTLEGRWRAWIKEESLCRLGWSIYVYDTTVSFHLNKRPHASLATIHLSLPNSLEFWNAGSAQAWDALYPSEQWAPKRKPFRPLITSLYDKHTQFLPVIDLHHRDILIYTIARMLWTRMEMAASFKIYFSAAGGGPDQGRIDTLRAFDAVHRVHTMRPGPGHGFVTRHLQAQHMAHIHAADDFMGWLFLRLRGGEHVEKAEAKIREWGLDETRVRSTAFHSAQLLGLIRLFPENHPWETFNAFYGGVTLWYMACLIRQRRSEAPGTAVQIQLDVIDIERSHGLLSLVEPPARLGAWINGDLGPVTVGIHGVTDITGEMGPKGVRREVMSMLEKMSVWNIAQAFHKVFDRLVEPF